MSESEAPMPIAGPVGLVDSPATSRGAPSSSTAREGGYVVTVLLVLRPLPKAKSYLMALRGRNRWAQGTPSSTARPPCGVDSTPYSPHSSTSHGDETAPHKVASSRRVKTTSLKVQSSQAKSPNGGATATTKHPEHGPPQDPAHLQAHVHSGLEPSSW